MFITRCRAGCTAPLARYVCSATGLWTTSGCDRLCAVQGHAQQARPSPCLQVASASSAASALRFATGGMTGGSRGAEFSYGGFSSASIGFAAAAAATAAAAGSVAHAAGWEDSGSPEPYIDGWVKQWWIYECPWCRMPQILRIPHNPETELSSSADVRCSKCHRDVHLRRPRVPDSALVAGAVTQEVLTAAGKCDIPSQVLDDTPQAEHDREPQRKALLESQKVADQVAAGVAAAQAFIDSCTAAASPLGLSSEASEILQRARVKVRMSRSFVYDAAAAAPPAAPAAPAPAPAPAPSSSSSSSPPMYDAKVYKEVISFEAPFSMWYELRGPGATQLLLQAAATAGRIDPVAHKHLSQFVDAVISAFGDYSAESTLQRVRDMAAGMGKVVATKAA